MTTFRRALVTGASRGIGAAVARALAPDHRLLLGGRNRSALESLAAELPDATPWPVDLTDHAAVAEAAADIDPLDVVVHSAGIATLGRIADTDPAAWQENFDVNVVAVVELTRAVLPALRAAGGHVVLINSGSGRNARAGWGPYAASKFALRAFADALRAEEPQLRVTSVFPGRTATAMQEAVVASEGRTYDPAQYLRPESVASVVAGAVAATGDAHPTELVIRPR